MTDQEDVPIKTTEKLKKTLTETTLAEVLKPMTPFFEGFQKLGQWMENLKIDPALLAFVVETDGKSVKSRIDGLRPRSREAISTASSRGWFFNWDNSFRDTFRLVAALKDATADDIDEILRAHYTEDLAWYTKQLTDKYPERKLAIEAAVNAHKNHGIEGYYLSIPVFIAQADGILNGITGIEMPLSEKNQTERNKYILEKIGKNQRAKDLLQQILNLETMDIVKSKKQRNKATQDSGNVFNALNRHQVLHGEVSNYGTEINSLKAFSFLAYIGTHIPEMIRAANAGDFDE